MTETSNPQTAGAATKRIKALLTEQALPVSRIHTTWDHGTDMWLTTIEPSGSDRSVSRATIHKFMSGRTEFVSAELTALYVVIRQRR